MNKGLYKINSIDCHDQNKNVLKSPSYSFELPKLDDSICLGKATNLGYRSNKPVLFMIDHAQKCKACNYEGKNTWDSTCSTNLHIETFKAAKYLVYCK